MLIGSNLLEVMATSYSSFTTFSLGVPHRTGNKEIRVFILLLLLALIE